ncbi:neuronal acetylcholine receptor subunit alpha-9-like precursor [Aplysia californica]|uniref:Neuronal acetylcholine receptor subunit alpha-9-like precursor n=1 Tax=Aplysia californica TaxID=6500 RepID=M4VRN7_APLCA|nr:neuronal acetylcholine receptor subunit alpha-9-like precursor [Aplysia californica]AGI03853.1 nicotinic acetylcholine receptor subunit type H [Aplysia californica]
MDVALIFFILSCLGTFQGCHGYNKTTLASTESESRLLRNLLSDYDKRIRPVVNPSDTVHASLGFSLKALLFLDERQEYIETSSYLMVAWHDGRLSWNSTQYMGIDSVRIPAEQLWKPDFTLYNGADQTLHVMDTMAVVYASGQVTWIPTLRLRSYCRVDLRSFPFDKQVCGMKFASYVYHGHQLNITYFGGSPTTACDNSDYVTNKNWALLGTTCAVKEKKYACCPDPYPHMQVNFTFQRNPDYYVQLFVFPAVLLGGLVPVTLLMPPESRERVTIGSFIVLGVLILSAKLCDVLPLAHAQLPAISIYYTLTLLWSVLSLACSVFVLNLHNRGPRRRKVPETIRWIFLRSLKRLVCLGSDSYYPLSDVDPISMRGLDKTISSQDRQLTNVENRSATTSKMEKDLEEITRQVNLLSARISVQDARDDALCEWRQVALVVDRVLFFFFSLIFLMCSVILLA